MKEITDQEWLHLQVFYFCVPCLKCEARDLFPIIKISLEFLWTLNSISKVSTEIRFDYANPLCFYCEKTNSAVFICFVIKTICLGTDQGIGFHLLCCNCSLISIDRQKEPVKVSEVFIFFDDNCKKSSRYTFERFNFHLQHRVNKANLKCKKWFIVVFRIDSALNCGQLCFIPDCLNDGIIVFDVSSIHLCFHYEIYCNTPSRVLKIFEVFICFAVKTMNCKFMKEVIPRFSSLNLYCFIDIRRYVDTLSISRFFDALVERIPVCTVPKFMLVQSTLEKSELQ